MDSVHEIRRIGEAAQPRLGIEVKLSALELSRYREINKDMNGWLLFWRHGVTFLFKEIDKALFDGTRDQDIKMLSHMKHYFGIEDVLKSVLVDIHETDWTGWPWLMHGVDSRVSRFQFFKCCFSSVRRCKVVIERFDFRMVRRRLHVWTEQMLRLVYPDSNVERVGPSNSYIFNLFWGWNGLGTNTFWCCRSSYTPGGQCSSMSTQ